MKDIIKIDEKRLFNYLKSLRLKRFVSIQDLEDKIENDTSISVCFEQVEMECGQKYDYCLTTSIYVGATRFCDIDVYYIRDNENKIVITVE